MSYQPPKPDATSDDPAIIRQHTREIAQAVRGAFQGKVNVVTSVTLAANTTTTTLTDPRLSFQSYIGLSPTTANAAAALATTYVSSKLNGSCVFTHANAATTDRTFDVVIFG